MSDIGNSPTTPAEPLRPEDAPPPRSGCLTALMVMVGIVLLLPGFCAIIFAVSSLGDPNFGNLLPVIVISLLIAFGGVMLLRAARRDPRR